MMDTGVMPGRVVPEIALTPRARTPEGDRDVADGVPVVLPLRAAAIVDAVFGRMEMLSGRLRRMPR